MNPVPRPSPETIALLRRESERQLTAEELDSWVGAPWAVDDLEQTLAHVRWFARRYPTPAARLQAGRAAARRARELAPR